MSFLGCRLCRACKVLITGHRVAFTEKRPGVSSWKTFSLMPHAVHHPVLAQTSTRAGGELAASHGSAAWILCQEPPLGLLAGLSPAARACRASLSRPLYTLPAQARHTHANVQMGCSLSALSVCALCLCALSLSTSLSVSLALLQVCGAGEPSGLGDRHTRADRHPSALALGKLGDA